MAQALTVYLTPKIDHPGDVPGPASDAASMGRAVLAEKDTDRLVRILTRARGTDDPWTILKAEQAGADSALRFTAWSGQEYKAVAPVDGAKARVESPVVTYDWTLRFTDEFDGDTLAPHWTHRGQDYRPDSTKAKGHPSAVAVTGGAARVKTIPDPDRPGYWLVGHIGTQGAFEFTYGWAAARVKFHRYAGSHAAFWLQSIIGYRIGGTEVDVAESFGSDAAEPDMRHNLYWSEDADQIPEQLWRGDTPGDWWDRYHVWAVRWEPDGYKFYLDGVRLFTANTGLSDSPHFLVLSIAAKDYEVGKMREDKPYTMHVDWVRVWD